MISEIMIFVSQNACIRTYLFKVVLGTGYSFIQKYECNTTTVLITESSGVWVFTVKIEEPAIHSLQTSGINRVLKIYFC